MSNMRAYYALFIVFIICFAAVNNTSARPFPNARTVYNAKELGAKGDGVTDDTEALKAAYIRTNKGGMLYLPAGTYLVSGPLETQKCSGNWIEGEGRDKTIIKLKDNCAGYGGEKHILRWG